MKIPKLFKKAAAFVMAAVTALSIMPATAFAAGDIGTISFSHTYDSSSLLTVWRLPIAFRGVEDKLKCFYHISQTKGGHKNRDIVNILPTLNTSFCLAAYIGRTNLPESRWEVKHNGKNY